jgi:hypothetical protein
MKVRNLIFAENMDEIQTKILNELNEKVSRQVKIALGLLPKERTFVAQVYVSGIDYVKVHHVKTGSIAIIEKDAEIKEGSIFIDKDMYIKQYFSVKPNHRNVSFSTEVERYTYKVATTADDAWGVIRLIISPD